MLQGKAGRVFSPEDISNIKITNIILNNKKVVRTTFTEDYLVKYSQDCWSGGKIITNKICSYGVKETVIEYTDGKWGYKKTENNNLVTLRVYNKNDNLILQK
ncbi:MAG: hypothetical protein LBK53_05805 [Heliobacteriaceae bacterium]|jgi:hypothetical protein|nr:hypothetical protein [Heliobacteriaceae bacterium]